jgi:hypothetical protein
MTRAEVVRRSRSARWAALPFALVILAGLAACSTTSASPPSSSTNPGRATASASPSVRPTTSPRTGSDESPNRTAARSAGAVEVRVLVGDRAFAAELYDDPTAHDLADHLPVTLTMDNMHGTEKTGRLPWALTTDGVPRGSDPKVDEIGYYAPGQDLVLYYRDGGYFDGIIRIGRFEDSIASIGDRPDGLTVTVERASS